MLDERPRRTAWLGLSCISTTASVWTTRARSAKWRMLLEMGSDARLVAEQQEAHVGMAVEGDGGPRHHDGRALVSAHGVERYGSRCCHDPPCSPVYGLPGPPSGTDQA